MEIQNEIKIKITLYKQNNFCTYIYTHYKDLTHSYMPYIELGTVVKKL